MIKHPMRLIPAAAAMAAALMFGAVHAQTTTGAAGPSGSTGVPNTGASGGSLGAVPGGSAGSGLSGGTDGGAGATSGSSSGMSGGTAGSGGAMDPMSSGRTPEAAPKEKRKITNNVNNGDRRAQPNSNYPGPIPGNGNSNAAGVSAGGAMDPMSSGRTPEAAPKEKRKITNNVNNGDRRAQPNSNYSGSTPGNGNSNAAGTSAGGPMDPMSSGRTPEAAPKEKRKATNSVNNGDRRAQPNSNYSGSTPGNGNSNAAGASAGGPMDPMSSGRTPEAVPKEKRKATNSVNNGDKRAQPN